MDNDIVNQWYDDVCWIHGLPWSTRVHSRHDSLRIWQIHQGRTSPTRHGWGWSTSTNHDAKKEGSGWWLPKWIWLNHYKHGFILMIHIDYQPSLRTLHIFLFNSEFCGWDDLSPLTEFTPWTLVRVAKLVHFVAVLPWWRSRWLARDYEYHQLWYQRGWIMSNDNIFHNDSMYSHTVYMLLFTLFILIFR